MFAGEGKAANSDYSVEIIYGAPSIIDAVFNTSKGVIIIGTHPSTTEKAVVCPLQGLYHTFSGTLYDFLRSEHGIVVLHGPGLVLSEEACNSTLWSYTLLEKEDVELARAFYNGSNIAVYALAGGRLYYFNVNPASGVIDERYDILPRYSIENVSFYASKSGVVLINKTGYPFIHVYSPVQDKSLTVYLSNPVTEIKGDSANGTLTVAVLESMLNTSILHLAIVFPDGEILLKDIQLSKYYITTNIVTSWNRNMDRIIFFGIPLVNRGGVSILQGGDIIELIANKTEVILNETIHLNTEVLVSYKLDKSIALLAGKYSNYKVMVISLNKSVKTLTTLNGPLPAGIPTTMHIIGDHIVFTYYPRGGIFLINTTSNTSVFYHTMPALVMNDSGLIFVRGSGLYTIMKDALKLPSERLRTIYSAASYGNTTYLVYADLRGNLILEENRGGHQVRNETLPFEVSSGAVTGSIWLFVEENTIYIMNKQDIIEVSRENLTVESQSKILPGFYKLIPIKEQTLTALLAIGFERVYPVEYNVSPSILIGPVIPCRPRNSTLIGVPGRNVTIELSPSTELPFQGLPLYCNNNGTILLLYFEGGKYSVRTAGNLSTRLYGTPLLSRNVVGYYNGVWDNITVTIYSRKKADRWQSITIDNVTDACASPYTNGIIVALNNRTISTILPDGTLVPIARARSSSLKFTGGPQPGAMVLPAGIIYLINLPIEKPSGDPSPPHIIVPVSIDFGDLIVNLNASKGESRGAVFDVLEPTISVTLQVLDSNGDPSPGITVNVSVNGSTKSFRTNTKGEFIVQVKQGDVVKVETENFTLIMPIQRYYGVEILAASSGVHTKQELGKESITFIAYHNVTLILRIKRVYDTLIPLCMSEPKTHENIISGALTLPANMTLYIVSPSTKLGPYHGTGSYKTNIKYIETINIRMSGFVSTRIPRGEYDSVALGGGGKVFYKLSLGPLHLAGLNGSCPTFVNGTVFSWRGNISLAGQSQGYNYLIVEKATYKAYPWGIAAVAILAAALVVAILRVIAGKRRTSKPSLSHGAS